MKTLSHVLAALFVFASVAVAGDYAIVRDKIVFPGGGTGTNFCIVYPRPSGNGAELIEVSIGGGLLQDTCTVSRITWCGCFTNQLLSTLTLTNNTVSFIGSNFTSVASSPGTSDYFRFMMTGTNTPTRAYWVYRSHDGAQK